MIKITITPPKSNDFSVNEAYKTLRTNILWGLDKKIICFTSSFPGEGKSSVALNVALALVEQGKEVLFIDADMRKSVLHKRIGIERYSGGLSELLVGKKKIDDVLCSTNIPDFYIIFAGNLPPNPSELLGHSRFTQLIEVCKEVYDYVIIDTPPIGNVIDAAIVAKSCDGIVLVIEAGKTEAKIIKRNIQQLEQLECPIMGCVMNKVHKKTDSYYGKYYGNYCMGKK